MPNLRFRSDQEQEKEEHNANTVIDMYSNGSAGTTSSEKPTSESHLKRTDHSGSTLNMPSVDIPSNMHDDFNWDNYSEEGDDEDTDDEGAQKVTGFWRLHPLVRALCIMLGGGIIFIIPVIAVMASHPELPFRDAVDRDAPDGQFQYDIQCVARSFSLICAVWVFGTLIYHLVDLVPRFVLTLVRAVKGKHNIEKIKDRLQFYIAVKLYIKLILISATSLVSFVVMFPNSSYRFIGKIESGKSTWDQVLFQFNILALFACGIIGIEKLLLKVIATRFHRSAYRERIEQQTYASWVLDHLNHAREVNAQGSEGNTADNTPYMFNNTATFTGAQNDTMTEATASRKELLQQTGDEIRAVPDDKMASPPPLGKSQSGNSTGSSLWRNTFSGSRRNSDLGHRKRPSKSIASRLWDIKGIAMEGGIGVNSNQYASRLARKLFSALHGDRNYLVVDDFLPFFDKEEEAIKAFEFFDKDDNGDISKKEMRNRVVLIYKERRALLNALGDMSQVVGKVDMFMTILCLFVLVVIALLVFGLDALKSLATMGTLFIGWSFVFGSTFKNVFECIVFLFQIHPYDVGDNVVINTERFVVHKIRLLSTVFFKWDGTYTVFQNSVLATQKLENLRRSNPQFESIKVGLDFHTPTSKIWALRDRMNEFCEENPRDYSGPISYNLMLLENVNRIELSVGINYKNNWQDVTRHFRILTEFSVTLRNAIVELQMRYSMPLQPVTMVQPPPGYDEASVVADMEKRQSHVSEDEDVLDRGHRSESESDEDDIFGPPPDELHNGNAHAAAAMTLPHNV